MAMKRPKNANGARWKKGHSCVSNSLNTRHRDAAKGRFFQVVEGEENALTVDALAKHAATLTVGTDAKTLSANVEDDESIGRSFNTFATNFTSCTIPAFEKFFHTFKIESDLHKRMLAVHAVAQEYLKTNCLPETSTSYLCAFIVSLDGVKESEEDVAATLSLISRVIRKVSPEVLRAKYGEIEKLLHDIFTVYADSDNKNILINVIGCLSVLLRMQDKGIWEHSFTINILKKILVYVTCENAKVRKCAQYSVSAILKGSCFLSKDYSNTSEDEDMDEDFESNGQLELLLKNHFQRKPVIIHPAAKDVGEFILYNLKLATNSNNGKLTLHLLLFLQQVICHLPKDTLKKCCSTILGIMHIGDAIVNSRSLKVLQVLFSSEFTTTLEKDVNEALINALIHSSDIKRSSITRSLKLIPNMNDSLVSSCWMMAVSYGILHLMRLDERSGIDFFGPFMELLTTFWKSDHAAVHEQVFFTIEYLLDECLVPLGDKFASLYSNEVLRAFEVVELALSFQFQSSWPFVFKSLAAFYRVLGKYYAKDMMKCLKNLSEMSSENMPHRDLIENVIGCAVKSIGPELVLQAVSFQITGNISTDEKHFWILPLLARYVKGASLCFFVSYFIPLANKCALILKTYNMKLEANREDRTLQVLVNTYETVERQIWFLFKSFANEATDVKEAISKDGGGFAKLIFDCIRLREDIRVDILKGLRNIITASNDEPDEIIKYSKNYLPALFNLYLRKPHDKEAKVDIDPSVESGHRLAVYETIQKYLEVIPTSDSKRFFLLVMNRYDNEASSSTFTHKALLNLARTFIPYLDESTLKDFFSKVSSCVLSKESKVQKTLYRIIEDVLSLQNESFFHAHHDEIFNLLNKSRHYVSRNAWSPRLKCYYHLLTHFQSDGALEIEQDKIIKQIVLEVISCCGAQNSMLCRRNAFSLLVEIGNTIQRLQHLSCEETFTYYYKLLPKLEPESPSTSNTIQALRFLAYKFKDSLPSDKLIPKVLEVSTFLPTASRDIVKSSLAFIRLMFLVNPPVLMSELVDSIMKSVLQMPRERRKIFRLQIRDLLACFVRKYGSDKIKTLVPDKDDLRKILIGVIKTESRKKRKRKLTEKDEIEQEENKSVPLSLDEILSAIDKEIEEDNTPNEEKKEISKTAKHKKQTWIIEEEDDIVDLLDLSSCRNIKTKEPKTKHLRFEIEGEPKTDEEKYGFRIDRKTNKFVITEKEEPEENKDNDFMALQGLSEVKIQPKEEQTNKRKRTMSQNSNDSEGVINQKELKVTGKRNKFDYGAEFRSKKAGGDKMKKLGIAPYAYVQFSREKLNRRKKSKFAGQYKELVKSGKRNSKGKIKKKKT